MAGRTAQPRLAQARPDLLAEWDADLNGREPVFITLGSSKRVWWRCGACGHRWQTSTANRVYRRSGCPRCARQRSRRPAPGRSLLEVSPLLASEWHPVRNADLGPGDVAARSKRVVWWRCPECGHEWHARVDGRVRRQGEGRNGGRCPSCGPAKTRGMRRGDRPPAPPRPD